MMRWSEEVTNVLERNGLFENEEHRERFREAVDCYENCSFFTSGLCKCLYLASWDMDHFALILETLNGLVARREKTLKDMRIAGEQMVDEMEGGERYVMQLSVAFLNNESYELEDSINVTADIQHIIYQALKAAKLIDEVEAESK